MDRILENEIYRLIKRFPTESELKSAKKYIDEYVDSETTADDLRYAVIAWYDAEMGECVHCWRHHLIDEMLDVYGDKYCDELCLHAAEQGVDLHAEARAEYECSNR